MAKGKDTIIYMSWSNRPPALKLLIMMPTDGA